MRRKSITALQILAAMASKNRRQLLFFLLALLALLLVSNLSQIGAETSENGEGSQVAEAVEEEEGDGVNETVQDGEYDEDEEDEEEEEDGEENGDEKALDETDVVVLGSSNFTAFVTKEQYVLVEFYAPWCGHCQELAPEWAAAATALKGRVSVAKVDTTSHTSIGEKFSVVSYPTLFFFVDGGHVAYTGERTK